jgi:hypothetical protein
VEFAKEERAWVAVIDWNAVRHASDDAKGSTRRAAS